MWRLLLQAGVGFATFDIGRRIARIKRYGMFFGVAGVLGLLGLGALTAAAAIALEPRVGAAGACAIVGAALLVLAGLIAWAATWERKPARPTPLAERMRGEIAAAGAAISSARAARAARAEDTVGAPPPSRQARRKRAVNMVLLATLAGVVLGRRL